MTTKYFAIATDALSKTQGSADTVILPFPQPEATFEETGTFTTIVSSDNPSTGTHSVSVNMANVGADYEWRFRIQALNSSDVVQTSSGYSATFVNVAGIQTANLTLTFGGSSTKLRLSLEFQDVEGEEATCTVNVGDADCFVDAPWTAGGPTAFLPTQKLKINTLLRM